MKLSTKAIMTATAIALALGAQAKAATVPALAAGGHTIAGPGLVNVPKTTMQSVMSNYFGNDACVTVVNLGTTDLTVDTAGSGPSSTIVGAHQSSSLCQQALTGVTITCSGPQSGDCHALWRVDR
jgi:hypothetical protein